MKIRDRIKEFRRVAASEIIPHPQNWRTHPDQQRNAFRGILAEVGIAGAVVCYETPHGLQLIDGHLRTEEIGPHAQVPVLVLDVNEDEAKKLLLTFDPVSDLAGVDAAALEVLLNDVSCSSDSVTQLLDKIALDNGVTPPDFQPATIEEQGKLDEKAKTLCPNCGHEF